MSLKIAPEQWAADCQGGSGTVIFISVSVLLTKNLLGESEGQTFENLSMHKGSKWRHWHSTLLLRSGPQLQWVINVKHNRLWQGLNCPKPVKPESAGAA